MWLIRVLGVIFANIIISKIEILFILNDTPIVVCELYALKPNAEQEKETNEFKVKSHDPRNV